VKTGFFDYLDFALQFAPAGPEEKTIREKLARLGIAAGKTFDLKSLSPEQEAAMAEGMKPGEAKVEDMVKNLGTKINGWNIARSLGTAHSSTATGSNVPLPQKRASTATMPSRPCIL
jgi:hypothetical protein